MAKAIKSDTDTNAVLKPYLIRLRTIPLGTRLQTKAGTLIAITWNVPPAKCYLLLGHKLIGARIKCDTSLFAGHRLTDGSWGSSHLVKELAIQ